MAGTAIDLALAAYQRPVRLRMMNEAAAHPDILMLIKIAAGDEASTKEWASRYNIPEATLLEASVFYLRSLIAAAGTDPYKLLCLSSKATLEQFTAHKRWLLRWLHPDRNGSVWESALFTRVATAARILEQQLKSGEGAVIIDAQATAKPAFNARTARFTHTRSPQMNPQARRAQLHALHRTTPKTRSLKKPIGIAAVAVTAVAIAFFAGRMSLAGDFNFTTLPWHG